MAETAAVPAARHDRAPDASSVGMVVWLASELMFFAGLFAAWFMIRAEADRFPPEGIHLPVARTAAATVVLIVSSVTIHLAGSAAKRRDRTAAIRWLIVTIVLGLVFLANQAVEYREAEFSVSTDAYSSIFYVMTGFHGLHVLGGIILLASTAGIIAGTSRAPAHRTVEMASYYWHFVDVVWVAMFLTIYVLQ